MLPECFEPAVAGLTAAARTKAEIQTVVRTIPMASSSPGIEAQPRTRRRLKEPRGRDDSSRKRYVRDGADVPTAY
jgi:hypothetical protein